MIAGCWLLTAADCVLLIAGCWMLTAAHCLLLTAHCVLQGFRQKRAEKDHAALMIQRNMRMMQAMRDVEVKSHPP